MKEDWLNDIHDKLIHYEAEEAPRGLWQDISRARAAQQAALRKKTQKRIVWLWVKCASAVAAGVVVVLTLGHWLNKEELGSTVNTLVAHIDTVNKKEYHTNAPTKVERPQVGAPMAELTLHELKHHSVESMPTDTIAYKSSADESSTSETAQSVVASQSKLFQQAPRSNETTHTDYSLRSSVSTEAAIRSASRLSLSAYTTGALTESHRTHSTGEFLGTGLGPDYADWQDDPVLGMLLYNQGKGITTRMKHHLPVKVGFTLAYALNRRLSLETGLMYSRLTSDLREGSVNHYFTGQQTLHYVGIPLGVKCQVLTAKRFEAYASSGIEVSKCVSGQTRKDYVLNNEIKKTETISTTDHPFQWSVKVAAGIQYNVLPQFGIYAEPGVSYYIKDGSSLRTIYKDKPFNFDLHVGVRVNLGR